MNKYFILILPFIHGAVLMLIFTLSIMSDYEDGIYQQIIESSIKIEDSDEIKALKLLEVSHKFLKPRLELFDGKKRINLRDTIFRSSDIELIDYF